MDPTRSPVSVVKGTRSVKSAGEARKRRSRDAWGEQDPVDTECPGKSKFRPAGKPIPCHSSAAVAVEAAGAFGKHADIVLVTGRKAGAGAARGTAPFAAPLRPAARPYKVPDNLDAEIGTVTDEVHERMCRLQNHMRVVNPELDILKYRRILVDWMAEVGEHFELQTSTIHVAIALFDRVLQTTSVGRSKLQMVALVCIIIAGKYEEMEMAVPRPIDMVNYVKEGLTPEMLNHMEITVLGRLDWNVTEFVPLHFLGYYFSKGVVFHEDLVDNRSMVERVPQYILKYHHFFAELCVQEYRFQAYSSSHTAAAIVAASRRALRITPLWRPELTELTGFAFDDIRPCLVELWNFFAATFPDNTATYAPMSAT